MLYVLDHVDKKLIVIDPSHVPEWCEDIPYRKYGNTITQFYKKYIAAMKCIVPIGTRISTSGSSPMRRVLLKMTSKGKLLLIVISFYLQYTTI